MRPFKGSPLLALLLSFIVGFHSQLLSQEPSPPKRTIIRERVELSVESRVKASLAETPPHLIAPRTGTLLIQPWSVWKLESPTPSSAYLQITINDTLAHRMEVLPFLSESRTSTDFFEDVCTGGAEYLTHYFNEGPLDSSYAIQVTAGDRVAFLYHTDIDVPMKRISSYLEYEHGYATLFFWVQSSCYRWYWYWPPLFVFTDYASFNVRYEEGGCEDAPPCQGQMATPQITLKELKRNEVSPDPCLQPDKQGRFPAGRFRPLAIRENPVSPFEVQACFDQQADRWRFGVPAIEIKVFLDICENNLLGYRIIDDISTLSSYEACNALADVIGHYEYPVRVTFWYVFRPILLAHERRHKQDYEKALSQVLPEFEKDIRKILLKCEEAGTLNDAVKKGRDHMTVAINFFLNKVYAEYLKTTSQPNYEKNTQNSLRDQVKTMRNQLVVKCAGGTSQ